MRRIAAILSRARRHPARRLGTGASGDGGGYQVRAIFDNGAFLVPGEEVRIAGARVGSVSSVDVTGPTSRSTRTGAPSRARPPSS